MALTGTVAGDFGLGMPMTVLLDEGAITVSEGLSPTGRTQKNYAFAAPVKVGDIVELFNNTALTYENTGGLPVMRKPRDDGNSAGVYGRIVMIDVPKRVPAEGEDTTALADRLTKGYLRLATVEILGLKGANAFEVKQNSSNALAVGAAGKLSPEFASGVATGYIKVVGSGGTLPMRSFHYIAAGAGSQPALLGVF
ncbi:MAG: hypothetical protein N3G75_06295 [Methanothrix sp.]|nr:hypothetical protein [Methanothrix sp.]MCX8207425.1 hypothetical protein [Methanothrix sp.]